MYRIWRETILKRSPPGVADDFDKLLVFLAEFTLFQEDICCLSINTFFLVSKTQDDSVASTFKFFTFTVLLHTIVSGL